MVLGRISDAIANMHKFADTMLAASQAVERAAGSLRGSVDGFLRKVASYFSPDLTKYFASRLVLRGPQM